MSVVTERSTGLAARPDRVVVAVSGPDAAIFLHGLVTNTVKTLAPGEGRFGALLTPQGKILFDFFLTRAGDDWLFEIDRAAAAAFAKRLGFYRLRAAVTVADRSDAFAVFVAWGEPPPAVAGAVGFADPRLPELGTHLLVPADAAAPAVTADLADWQARRIALAVPESGADFLVGDAFPHDVDMDDLDGVDFVKGCFIGQEVVSRMKHRGTARKRFVVVTTRTPDAALPAMGAEIYAGDRVIGRLGSSIPGRGLAEIRLDRAAAARAAGLPIVVEGVEIDLELPPFARFGWPEPEAEA